MNDGTFITTKNTREKMLKRVWNILLFMTIFGLLKYCIISYLNGNSSIYSILKPFILVMGAVVIAEISYNFYRKYIMKQDIDIYEKQNEWWLYSFLLAICMPISIPIWIYMITFVFMNIYTMLDKQFLNLHINITAIGIFIMTLLLEISGCMLGDISKYLSISTFENELFIVKLPLFTLLSFFYLNGRKAIKGKITIITLFFLFTLYWFVGWLGHETTSLRQILPTSVLFLCVFVVPNIRTSPVTPIGQTLFSLMCATVTLICSYGFMFPKPIGLAIGIVLSNVMTVKFDIWGSFGRGNVKRYSMIGFLMILFGIVIAYQIGMYI